MHRSPRVKSRCHILSVNLTVRSSFQIVPADVSRVELNLRIIHFRRAIIVLPVHGEGEAWREKRVFPCTESIRDVRESTELLTWRENAWSWTCGRNAIVSRVGLPLLGRFPVNFAGFPINCRRLSSSPLRAGATERANGHNTRQEKIFSTGGVQCVVWSAV